MSDKKSVKEILNKLPIQPGDLFVHYKGGHYEVITLAIQEDTLEPLVVYRSKKDDSVWVRTYKNFTEDIEVGGKKIKRFARISA